MAFQMEQDDRPRVAGRPPVVFLMGPTAAGKTAVAMALAERLPVELVSVDAAQIYRGMDIGTAKPSAAELARAPHRLIDIRDPEEAYSAADFATDAAAAIAEIRSRGRVPLLVGGTMFYFHSLERGLPDLPSADAALRARFAAEAVEVGWGVLHERLAQADPEAARRIHRNDPQRIQRALEILELTGQGPTHFRERTQGSLGEAPIKVVLAPAARAVLHERIAHRFEAMLAAGLVTEVERLLARPGLVAGLPSMRTVGYRQVAEYLTGTVGYTEMQEHAVAATRQFAKRQYTWLRRETAATWFDGTAPDCADRVAGHVVAMMARAGYTF